MGKNIEKITHHTRIFQKTTRFSLTLENHTRRCCRIPARGNWRPVQAKPRSGKIQKKTESIGFGLDGSLAPSPSDPLTLLGANRSLAPKSEHKCMEGCTWDPSRQKARPGKIKKKTENKSRAPAPPGLSNRHGPSPAGQTWSRFS